MFGKGGFNKLVPGADAFVACLKDEDCMKNGMAQEFSSPAAAVAVVEEVLKIEPDAYACFRFAYKRGGGCVLSFGTKDMQGRVFKNPRRWWTPSVQTQVSEFICDFHRFS